jgi:hypothetical protein
MTTMKEKIEAVRIQFDRKNKDLTARQLIKFPEGSLGQQLGRYLIGTNDGQNVIAQREDIFQFLIAGKYSFKEDIAVQYYLFGNGKNSMRNLLAMAVGLIVCPQHCIYFYNRYKDGKQALRFYDLDHFGMLHLPVNRIKETFLIR